MVAVGLSLTNLLVGDGLTLLDNLLASGHSRAARAFENDVGDVTHLEVCEGFRSWVSCYVDVRRCVEIAKEFKDEIVSLLWYWW